MKRLLSGFLVAMLSLGLLQTAPAQNTATQDVTISVSEITTLDVSGGSVTFDFTSSDATAGSATATLSATRTYSLFTNVDGTGVKITGKLGSDFATGITLKADLTAPSNAGSSQGLKSLSTTATDLVTGISPTSESNLNISYTAEITPQAAPSSGTTETVTYTVTAQ